MGRPRQRAQSCIPSAAAVIDRGARHVQHPRAGLARAQPVLPLLLVAAVRERHVEHPHPFQRSAPDRHVRAPRIPRLGVVLTEVERRDRRSLASARAWRTALQARSDPPRQHVCIRMLTRGCEQCRKPAEARFDVVIHEHHQLAVRALDTRVARHVQAQLALVRLIPRAQPLCLLASLGRGAGVVDHEHLRAHGTRLGDDRGERHLQVCRTPARGNHDRGGGGLGTHAWQSLGFVQK